MKTKDHRALAEYLLKSTQEFRPIRFQIAFILGCVEPDCNPFTYLRGFFSGTKFCGHNVENSWNHILKILNKNQEKGINSVYEYFVFGTLIHYVADAFTYPHNIGFDGNMFQHRAYEKELHAEFQKQLSGIKSRIQEQGGGSVEKVLEEKHRDYCLEQMSYQNDSKYILKVCAWLFAKLVWQNERSRYPLICREEIINESFNYNRLV